MQDVNPDMDQLFKEAADNYPLQTNTADWKAVSQKLQANETNVRGSVYKERKWIVLFLLLLIPMRLINTQYFKVQNKQLQTALKVKDRQIKSSDADKTNNRINEADQDEQMNTEKISQPVSKGDYRGQKGNNHITMQRDKGDEQEKLVIASLSKNKIEYTDLNELYLSEHLSSDLMLRGKTTILIENNKSEISGSIQHTNSSAKTNKGASKKNSKESTSKLKRFYIGAVIAPELISVKFQPVKRTSFNLGVLMGYSLSDKIGLELGATLAHKYFYTNGKYIAPYSIRRDNSTILNVDAFTSITEMPLTLQYTIKKEKNTRFFASAGCVSYVIHKEHYNYTYTKNGEEKQSITYYNKASNNWFSNAQVSVGYQYSVNKIGNIVIEPFYRIPLKGIGISDLPITSIGINFALTKNLK
jgi:hypothetical protein